MITMHDPCGCNSGKIFKACCYEIIRNDRQKDLAKSSSRWPVYLCLVGKKWETSGIMTILIAKMMPNGNFIAGFYLLDAWCLGIKSTDVKVNISQNHLECLQRSLEYSEGAKVVAYEEARGLILGGVLYAANLGFTPHPNWKHSQHLVEPHRSFVNQFQFGREGKPCFIAEPYDDNVDEIHEKLEKAAGH